MKYMTSGAALFWIEAMLPPTLDPDPELLSTFSNATTNTSEKLTRRYVISTQNTHKLNQAERIHKSKHQSRNTTQAQNRGNYQMSSL